MFGNYYSAAQIKANARLRFSGADDEQRNQLRAWLSGVLKEYGDADMPPVALAVKLYQDDCAPLATANPDKVRKSLSLLIAEHAESASLDDLNAACAIIEEVESLMDIANLLTLREIDGNLAMGPKQAAKDRKKKGDRKLADLTKAIGDLFDKPEKPGWGWGNQEIVDFLKKGNYGYAESTLLRHVKREVAICRKAQKTPLASEIPKRYSTGQ